MLITVALLFPDSTEPYMGHTVIFLAWISTVSQFPLKHQHMPWALIDPQIDLLLA